MTQFCNICKMEFGNIDFEDSTKVSSVIFHYYEFHRQVFHRIIKTMPYNKQDHDELVHEYENRLQNKLSK